MRASVDKRLQALRDKGQKEMYNPSKGLMDILAESKVIHSESLDTQSTALTKIVESSESTYEVIEKIDYGIGKIVSIIQQALDIVNDGPPPTPTKGMGCECIQAIIDSMWLTNIHLEEGLGLQRGVLFNLTKMAGFLEGAEDARLAEKDKKTFLPPKEREKDKGPNAKVSGLGAFLASALAFLASPLKFILKEAWALIAGAFRFIVEKVEEGLAKLKTIIDDIVVKMKTLLDDAILKSKTFIAKTWDDFTKWFSFKFPKTASFIDDAFLKFTGFFSKIWKLLPDGVQKFIPKLAGMIPKFFGKIISGATKFIMKANPYIILVDMVYNFFTGWFNAKQITGKEQNGFFDRVMAGVMGILSSFTLGFIPASDFYEVIFGDFGIIDIIKGWFGSLWDMLPDGLQLLTKQIGGLFSIALGELSLLWEKIAPRFSITDKVESVMDEIAKWINDKISIKNLMPSFLGGESEQDRIDAINAKNSNSVPVMVKDARAIAKDMDMSSASLSNKKAAMEAQANKTNVLVQPPPATVINNTPPPFVNMFEADLQAMLIGR